MKHLSATLAVVVFAIAPVAIGFAAAPPVARAPANSLDAVASCYPLVQRERPAAEPEYALFVLIDQTTTFDGELRATVVDTLARHRKPNAAFSIATFSAYLDDRYTNVRLAGRLDPQMPTAQRNDTGKPLLRRFDACMASQVRYAAEISMRTLQESFAGASRTIAKSDIFTSLHDYAQHSVRTSRAVRRTLLIASDMLENSALTSFYASQTLRHIDPDVEMKKVRERGLVPDLAGVRVYVVGAGLIDTSALARTPGASYRDPIRMQALERFWSTYFKEAKAELVEFGRPQLLQPVD